MWTAVGLLHYAKCHRVTLMADLNHPLLLPAVPTVRVLDQTERHPARLSGLQQSVDEADRTADGATDRHTRSGVTGGVKRACVVPSSGKLQRSINDKEMSRSGSPSIAVVKGGGMGRYCCPAEPEPLRPGEAPAFRRAQPRQAVMMASRTAPPSPASTLSNTTRCTSSRGHRCTSASTPGSLPP